VKNGNTDPTQAARLVKRVRSLWPVALPQRVAHKKETDQ